MKKLFIYFVLLIAITSCNCTKDIPSQDFELEKIITDVQKEYAEAIIRLKNEGITDVEITKAELSLAVTNSINASGELAVAVFTGSGSHERNSSSTITFALAKPTKAEEVVVEQSSQPKLESLADLIVESGRKFHNLKGTTIGDLEKDSFELDIAFSIKNEGGGKFTFKIWGIGGEAGATKSKEVAHEIKLTFKEVPKPEKPKKSIDDVVKILDDIVKDIAGIKAKLEK